MATSKLFQVEQTGAFVGLGIRKQRVVMRATHYAMGAKWDKDYLPSHFKLGAGRRYGYQKRSAQTRERKKRLAKRGKVAKRGYVDLVHSGLLESLMIRQHVIKAYPSRVVVPMPTATYVSSRPRGNAPNMALEITTVIPSEAAGIRQRAEETLNRETEKAIVDNRRTKKV